MLMPASSSLGWSRPTSLPRSPLRRDAPHVRNTTLLAPPRSFLGVGAPEALLVGVVALVVFGPKGLAEAARSVGAALRSFQPTIKEVVEVSQDIKGTLEKELGLDELRDAARLPPAGGSPSSLRASAARSMDDLLRSPSSVGGFAPPSTDDKPGVLGDIAASAPGGEAADPDIEAKRAASAALAWGVAPPAQQPGAQPVSVAALSTDDLEAELARRKAAAAAAAATNKQQQPQQPGGSV